jgi:RNA polymerase sigma-70 factor (ECF subfamily)
MAQPSLCMAEELDADTKEQQVLGLRLARGDKAAFDSVVDLYAPFVRRRLARRLLGWQQADAEDVTQDVFVHVYLKARAFRGGSSLQTWLTRITINRCRTLQRRKWLKLDRLWRAIRERAAACDALEQDETARCVRAAVQTLPLREREVVVMYYLEELTVCDIAAVLQMSQGAVNVRLHRARKRLQASLTQYGGRTSA